MGIIVYRSSKMCKIASNNKKTRIEWVDVAKGIGIILVVLGHAILGNKKFFPQDLSDLYYFMYNFIWNFHMPLFFFISGLFINGSVNKPFKKAFISKSMSLFYPYIVWSVILGCTYVILGEIPQIASGFNNNITMKDLILFPVVPILNLWFLQTLFCAQIIYIFLAKIFKINIYQGLILFFILYILAHMNIITISYPLGLFSALFFLFLGALFFEKIKDFEFNRKNSPLIITVVSLFVIINSIFSINNTKIIGFGIIIATLGVLSTIFISIYILKYKFSEYLVNIGKMSMVIYLLHVFITPGTRIIISKIIGTENLIALVLIPTIMGIVIPIIFYHFSEKIKITKYLFGR